MRFRFIDDKGREVDLQSVEALSARVQLGAVHEESPLYDVLADKWAPAGEHELFRQLKSESAAHNPSGSMPSPLLGAVRSEASGPAFPPQEEPEPEAEATEPATHLSDAWEPTQSPESEDPPETEVPLEPVSPSESLDPLAPLEPMDPLASMDLVDAFQDEGSRIDSESLPDADSLRDEDSLMDADSLLSVDAFPVGDSIQSADSGGSGSEPDFEGFDLPGDLELTAEMENSEDGQEDGGEEEGQLEGLLAGRADGETQSPSGAAAMPGWAAAPPPPTDFSDPEEESEPLGTESSPEETAAEQEYLIRTESEARKASARARAEEREVAEGGGPRKRNKTGSPFPFAVLILAALLAVVASAVTLLLLRDPGPDSLVQGGPESGAEVSPAGSGRVRPAAVVLEPDEAAALTEGVRVGVDQALALLDELAAQAGVGEGPPEEWLRGIYLANASSYASVIRHWETHRGFVSAARGVILPRFRSASEEAMVEGGLTADQASDVYQAAGHWVTPIEWEITDLLTSLEDLAVAALDLHEYLVSVEDRIRYDPFEDTSVPVDPIVEAIPLDDEVEDEMWGRIGRVADEFRRTEDLREGLPLLAATMAQSIREEGR